MNRALRRHARLAGLAAWNTLVRQGERLAESLPLSSLLRQVGGGPLVIYYHAVADPPLPHVDALYRGRTPAEFDADLEYLLRDFRPITVPMLRRIMSGEMACPEKAFLVTFDDGLRETTENVLPLLSARGLDAAFFVSSGFIDNTDLSYRFKASLLVTRLRETTLTPATKNLLWALLRESDSTPAVSLEAALLSIQYPQRATLNRVADILGVSFANYLLTNRPYLDREGISSLSRLGFTVGAHSVDHPPYTELNMQDQLAQTRQSCLAISELTGSRSTPFAFPFSEKGVSTTFYGTLLQEGVVDLFFGTSGWTHYPERRLVSRVSFEGNRREAPIHLRRTLARHILEMGRQMFVNRLLRS